MRNKSGFNIIEFLIGTVGFARAEKNDSSELEQCPFQFAISVRTRYINKQ